MARNENTTRPRLGFFAAASEDFAPFAPRDPFGSDAFKMFLRGISAPLIVNR
jgi:hypothetical protein